MSESTWLPTSNGARLQSWHWLCSYSMVILNDSEQERDHLISPSSEDSENQPLLIAPSPHTHELKQEQSLWATHPNPSNYQLGLTPSNPSSRTLLFSAGLIIIPIFAAVSFFAFGGTFDCLYDSLSISSGSQTPTIQFAPPEIQHFWGAYTPYFPVKPYIGPPSHCHITQVRSILLVL